MIKQFTMDKMNWTGEKVLVKQYEDKLIVEDIDGPVYYTKEKEPILGETVYTFNFEDLKVIAYGEADDWIIESELDAMRDSHNPIIGAISYYFNR